MCKGQETGSRQNNGKKSFQSTKHIEEEGQDSAMSMFTIHTVEDKLNGCILVKPNVNGITLNMEVDTGATVSIV